MTLQIGLLPEPGRDASGYRRYHAAAVVALLKIRTRADAGVPLSGDRRAAPRGEEAADIMAALAEEAETAGQVMSHGPFRPARRRRVTA